ncbi:hypothetical protein C8R44DRAFT_726346 [Mycena epipterygia]|nr:hypothetical protein C8R44DRAFT_726346 [Mycena epipterygia]
MWNWPVRSEIAVEAPVRRMHRKRLQVRRADPLSEIGWSGGETIQNTHYSRPSGCPHISQRSQESVLTRTKGRQRHIGYMGGYVDVLNTADLEGLVQAQRTILVTVTCDNLLPSRTLHCNGNRLAEYISGSGADIFVVVPEHFSDFRLKALNCDMEFSWKRVSSKAKQRWGTNLPCSNTLPTVLIKY